MEEWKWGPLQLDVGEDGFGSVNYRYTKDKISDWEGGFISLMGSGSSFTLSVIMLVVLYTRKDQKRYPWLATFIVFIGIIDMFTYSVIPMIGDYVSLTNKQKVFNVTCGDYRISKTPQKRPSDFPMPSSLFEPQVRTVKIGCGIQNGVQITMVHLAVELNEWPESKRWTRLFVQIETPEGKQWIISNTDAEFEEEGYVAKDFFITLPPNSGEYQVKNAFLVIDGLRRLVFFYGITWKDGFILVEPLYGAVEMNINPFLFMSIISVISAILGFFLIRYVVIFRRKDSKPT